MGAIKGKESVFVCQEVPLRQHQKINEKWKSRIVILWGLLVYQQLSTNIKKYQQKEPQNITLDKSSIDVKHLSLVFADYFGNLEQCTAILKELQLNGFIRFISAEKLQAGPALFKSVKADKMFHLLESFHCSKIYTN